MSRPFPSRYENKGACARCHGDIKIGEMVLDLYKDSKDLAHETCPSATVSPPLPPSPLATGREEQGPGSWTLEFTQGSLRFGGRFCGERAAIEGRVEEFRAFTLAAVSP